MSSRKPLIVDQGQLQQLQGDDDLDIPLQDRVDLLELMVISLGRTMLMNGLEIDADVLTLLRQKG